VNWRFVLITSSTDFAQSCFGDAVLWFYDGLNGSVIAGLWNPHVVASRQWKITLGYSTLPVNEVSGDKVFASRVSANLETERYPE